MPHVANNNPYVGFQKDRRGTRKLWERFNAGLVHLEEVRDAYPRMLLTEWQRCASLGVNAGMSVGRRLDDEAFARRRESGSILLRQSVPMIADVARYLDDVPGILILTECTGTILYIAGRPEIRHTAAYRSGIIEGSQWDENIAGTNGIGSAMAKREPVHVYSSEHFCEGWHTWSCAAAPVLEPDGSLLGIIDFTTIDRDYRDQALGLVVSLASSIQSRIAALRQTHRSLLLAVRGQYQRRYPNDTVVAVDHAGVPLPDALDPAAIAGDAVDLPPTQTIDVLDPDTLGKIGAVAIHPAGPAGPARRSADAIRLPPPPTASDPTAHFGGFQSCDPATKDLLRQVERIASADVNVLVVGETGTGKELLARYIHGSTPRPSRPFVPVNCGAISRELLESTFFGYVGGAFSGADPKGRAGYFEAAEGGTLFLDEIGELPSSLQAALLRVLEDGSFQRVGSSTTQRARCRIVAATNRDLAQEVERGVFRRDLYYRLKVVTFELPPLRARRCDVVPLARAFVQTLANKHGRAPLEITPAAQALLETYPWPGNVRELRNAIESALLSAESAITPATLPPEMRSTAPGAPLPGPRDAPETLAQLEREVIIAALRKYRKVNRVAEALGIARSTLYKRFASLGIDHTQYL